MFDEKNITALETFFEDNASVGTNTFLQSVSNWWKCVNCKNKFSGKIQRDPYRNCIRSLNDDNVLFLKSFLEWVVKWNTMEDNRKFSEGKLSRDTYFSLKHTTESIIALCDYLLNSLQFEYVLLGKFQTDDLEGRFGQYRQMSGGHYSINCTASIRI